MTNNIRWFAAFAAVLMMGIAAAATASSTTSSTSGGSAIQVSSYSTIPDTVYRGSYAQLQLNLGNSGTETAQSVTIDYNYGTDESYMSVGDIGSGSSTITALPFHVPDGYNGAVIVVYLKVIYQDSGGQHTTYASIPVSISGKNSVSADVLGATPSEIYPGDALSVILSLKDIGGNDISDVAVEPYPDSGFFLNGTSAIQLGDMRNGESRNVSISLVMSSPPSYGRQMVPILITYQDELHNRANETVYAGPIGMMSSNTKWALSPLGSSRIYFDGIKTGETKNVNVTIGISSSAAAGYYDLPVSIISGNGQSWNGSMGVLVQATPELTISNGQSVTPGNESKVPIKIANTGNSAIRSAYVSIEPGPDSGLRVTSGTEFIGTLNVDDSYTAQPTVSVPFATGSYPLSVTVTYRDSMNQERNVTKEIFLDVGNSGSFSGSGSFNGNGTFARGQFTRNTGGIRVFGIDIVPIAAVLAVLGIGYFIWIKKFKRKKEEQRK
ncbi:MAG: hypothetical protein NTY68_00865 [Candidatus Micrarchaeota archaeon]|nr:hypothetical protein [Candidatus Micrarchaeota archaeon]